jgi:hypothetical protein
LKTFSLSAAILIALIVPQALLAQSPSSPNAAMAIQITNARKTNAALMRQYGWNSRLEVLDQGQVKDIRIDVVNYGPDGQLQRTIQNDQSAPLPFGFLRRRIAEHERKKVEDYLIGLRGLLEEYTLPTSDKVLAFMNTATTSGPDASGLFEMTGRNVVFAGDSFSVWTDARTRQTRKVQVTTTYQGDPVSLTATFKTITGGLTHVAYAEVSVPAKQMNVQVQNFDYNRNN